mgnify:CR=1 FL=1
MRDFLKNHPFAVQAFFKTSVVLTYSAPATELQKLIPECLTLDTFGNNAFVAVAMVQTRNLRPRGFPEFMGNNFFLAGYRIFVRYQNLKGKKLRGLYILKSLTDKKKMEVLGNTFTHYNYSQTDIVVEEVGGCQHFFSAGSGIDVYVEEGTENTLLPAGSPFPGWKEARRFAGPLPYTFTFNEQKKEVLIIEGVRENWTPQPLLVNQAKVSMPEVLKNTHLQLANAFIVKNIPYCWKKGVKETWKPNEVLSRA